MYDIHVQGDCSQQSLIIFNATGKMPSLGPPPISIVAFQYALPVLPLAKLPKKARTSRQGQLERLIHLTAVRTDLCYLASFMGSTDP